MGAARVSRAADRPRYTIRDSSAVARPEFGYEQGPRIPRFAPLQQRAHEYRGSHPRLRRAATTGDLALVGTASWSSGKVGVLGFEPRLSESESLVLPLHHTPKRLTIAAPVRGVPVRGRCLAPDRRSVCGRDGGRRVWRVPERGHIHPYGAGLTVLARLARGDATPKRGALASR